jgi:hypothetical protein
MTLEQFSRVHRAQPFQAYDLSLASGRTIRVQSPEFAAESGSGRTIAVWSEDAFEIIDLLLVGGIGVGNGRRSRRTR